MRKTLAEIASFINGELVGEEGLVITGLSGIKEGVAGDLTYVEHGKFLPLAEHTQASAIITPRDVSIQGKSIIRTDYPTAAFNKIAELFVKEAVQHFSGIHPTAQIAADVKLGKNVAVGPFVVIESGTRVGEGTIIYAGSTIGQNSWIGQYCLIYPRVTIRERITVGNRVIIHPGAVIGADGFGYNTENGIHHKVPQMGTVEIGDDVEIGANTTIDRARLNKTLIGAGTKIDNLVHIAHNVVIGEHSIIVAQVGIAGSVTVGRKASFGGQAGVAGHLTIGEEAVITAQAGVTRSVPAHTTVSGYPARPHEQAKKIHAHIQRLPQLVRTVEELKQKLIPSRKSQSASSVKKNQKRNVRKTKNH